MKSLIVSKFYTLLEKVGFKKHTLSDDEINFLNKMNDTDKIDSFIGEANYIIDRLKLKIKLSMIVATILLMFAMFFLSSDMFWMFVISLLVSLFLIGITKHFKSEIDVQNISRIIFKDAKEELIKQSFK